MGDSIAVARVAWRAEGLFLEVCSTVESDSRKRGRVIEDTHVLGRCFWRMLALHLDPSYWPWCCQQSDKSRKQPFLPGSMVASANTELEGCKSETTTDCSNPRNMSHREHRGKRFVVCQVMAYAVI
jgi:hypothetical protein